MRSLRMRQQNYDLKGTCVYCLQKFNDVDLTDEHIVPFALNGGLILKKGACRPHAQLSNELYENAALNADLFVPRRLLELKRRSRGKRQKAPRPLPMVAIGNHVMGGGDEVFNVQLSDDEYPFMFSLCLFPPAGRLVGVDRGGGLAALALQIFNLGGGTGRRNDVTTREPFVNGPFALTLAKVAYCYAAAEKGFGGFDGDDIRSLLLGNRTDVYNFVGNPEQPEVLADRHLHALYFRERGEWLTVLVHLFASCHGNPDVPTTPYEVVVGKLVR